MNYEGQVTQWIGKSRSLGFLGSDESPRKEAIVSQIPQSLLAAGTSVCGLKSILIKELREFEGEAGLVRLACAKVAVLDIEDSPVHVHGETTETYQILNGHGQMVLGQDYLSVKEGDFILIPPGIPHGLKTATGEPVRVLMTFAPGIAPMTSPEFRDEHILAASVEAYRQLNSDGEGNA